MATRSYTLSQKHVEALNRIDLEFSSEKPKEKKVIEVWRQYLDILSEKIQSPEQWALRRRDLLVDLLHAMGQCLGYDFDKTQIKNATYSPVAHGRIEEEQQAMRNLTLELLDGKRALSMFITNLPTNSPPKSEVR